jgi:hypothetical protein
MREDTDGRQILRGLAIAPKGPARHAGIAHTPPERVVRVESSAWWTHGVQHPHTEPDLLHNDGINGTPNPGLDSDLVPVSRSATSSSKSSSERASKSPHWPTWRTRYDDRRDRPDRSALGGGPDYGRPRVGPLRTQQGTGAQRVARAWAGARPSPRFRMAFRCQAVQPANAGAQSRSESVSSAFTRVAVNPSPVEITAKTSEWEVGGTAAST